MKEIKKILFYFILVTFVVFLSIFGYKNSATVPLDLVFFEGQYKMSLVIAGVLLTGFLLGLIGAMLINSKVKLSNKLQQRKQEAVARKEAKKQAKTEAQNTEIVKAEQQPATSLE